MIKNPFSSSGTGIVLTPLRSLSEKPHAYVAHRRREHAAWALYVESQPSIFLLMIVYVPQDFRSVFSCQYAIQMSHHVQGYHLPYIISSFNYI